MSGKVTKRRLKRHISSNKNCWCSEYSEGDSFVECTVTTSVTIILKG
jgi:hypothetical protein